MDTKKRLLTLAAALFISLTACEGLPTEPTFGLETGEVALSLAAMTADPVLIDFESLASTNGGFNVLPTLTYTTSEGGFTLVNTVGFLSPAVGNLFYSGTSATLMSFADGETTLSMEDAGVFNVESIDIIEVPLLGAVPRDITFTGKKAGSPPVSETLTTAGVPGPQTLNLSGSFTNLESLSWVRTGPAYHFDNIYITFSSDPVTRDDCKKGGWDDFDGRFRNQGQCVRFVEKNENAKDKR